MNDTKCHDNQDNGRNTSNIDNDIENGDEIVVLILLLPMIIKTTTTIETKNVNEYLSLGSSKFYNCKGDLHCSDSNSY